MMKTINKWIDRAESVALGISTISVVVIMVVTAFDVFFRKTVNLFIPGLYEITEEYLMVILVFLSMSHVYKIGGNVRLTLFVDRVFPPAVMVPINAILKVFYLLFFAIMVKQGLETAVQAWKFNEVTSCILAYPLAPALFVVPIGALLVCIRIIQAKGSTSAPETHKGN